MLFVYLNFLVAFLSLIAIIITIKSSKKNEEPINYYFLIILIGVAIQRFFYTLLILVESNIENRLSYSYVAYFYGPLLYLFIKDYLKFRITLKENFVHFTFAFIIILVNILIEINVNIKALIFFVFSTTYLIVILKKSLRFFKKNNLTISKKYWLFVMLFQILATYTISNILHIKFRENITFVHQEYYNFSATIWLFVLTYLFVNPEILFGVKKLKKIILSEEVYTKAIWRKKNLIKIKDYDQVVHCKVLPNVLDIISKINDFSENYYTNNTKSLNFDSLSDGIGINKYHLNYVFKYYCIYIKSDFFNYYKVQHALKLIEGGYLQNQTVSSLISDSHFKSKKTFYNNFRKFTGKNPLEINHLLKFKI